MRDRRWSCLKCKICFCDNHIRRKGIVYRRGEALPCPRCRTDVQITKEQVGSAGPLGGGGPFLLLERCGEVWLRHPWPFILCFTRPIRPPPQTHTHTLTTIPQSVSTRNYAYGRMTIDERNTKTRYTFADDDEYDFYNAGNAFGTL